jgi:hypothetical protein
VILLEACLLSSIVKDGDGIRRLAKLNKDLSFGQADIKVFGVFFLDKGKCGLMVTQEGLQKVTRHYLNI